MKNTLKNFSILFLLLTFQIAVSQEKQISGKITDENNLPLPAATVIVKGTTIGASSDFDGNYKINAEVGSTLEFRYVGFAVQLVTVGNSNTINVALKPSTESLDEVIVVGFGTTSKRNVTDNIATISSEDINEVPVPSLQSALTAKAAGVQVTQVNGKAESGIKVRVRGVSTISSSQEPLYVVDGIPIINSDESINDSPINPLISLNPNDIESIQILKDASSAAIYGARGTNGVVLITTKRGKTGKTKVGINSSYGFSQATNEVEFLNTREYVELFTEAANNSGYPLSDLSADFNSYSTNQADWQNAEVDTNWQDFAIVSGDIQQHDINVSGGTENTQFYISGGYNKTDGIIRGNGLERYTFRVNLNHKISDKFSVGLNSSIARSQISRLSNDNSFATPLQSVAQLPFSRPYEDDGITPNGNTLYYNFLFQEFNADHDSKIWRTLVNVNAQYEITDNLSFRTEFGYDFNNQLEERFFGSLTESASTNGFGDSNAIENEKYVLNNYLTYNTLLGENIDFEATGGMTYEEDNRYRQFVEGQEFPSDDLQTVDSASEIVGGGSSRTRFNFLSYFGRVNFNILGKYLFKASARYDGSSRFGVNEQYGFFPAASIGWIISEEDFLKDSQTLSLLKFRGSWGETGNAGIGNFASRSLFGGRSYNNEAALGPNQLGDPSLKWEKTTQYDIGLDFGFFNNRISGEIDYYSKQTEDLLLDEPVPATSGFLDITRNIGELVNEGVEFVLNTKNINTAKFSWSSSFNIAYNKNEVKKLPGGDIISGRNIVREGETLSSFYMVEYAGVDPNNGDALFYLNTTDANGVVIDRGTTNNFNEASRIVVGSPFPDIFAGFTNTLNFVGFDFSATFQGQWGASIYNGGGRFQSANADFYDNQTRDQLNRWQNPGDITNVPQARLFDGNGTQHSSRYLQDADFIRLRNVTLGYTIPKEITQRFHIERLRMYVTGINLATFTDYTGWDPESTADINANSNIQVGEDFYSAPPAKSLTLGVNIEF